MKYKTKTREIVMSAIKSYGEDFTVNDIYLKLNKKVGLTTVYRVINLLVNNDSINKIVKNDNSTYYQYLGDYDKDNQLFLKCEKCSKVIRIDCNCYKELYDHIFKNHNFQLTKNHIIINGLCVECIKE